ncbi:MAG TPA: peptidoglycan-binding domain-containing protein [Chthoniobacterales bacterium]|nr:peptidoglycan-binding domain-containing protein [Chthoniobacterales bacterium]
MKLRIAILVLLVPAGALFADPVVESVQQALKDEGFYYGDVTGNKDADTGAAIRRYQIRNGLQITGELNDETLKSLGVGKSGDRTAVKAAPTEAPQATEPPVARAPLKKEPEPEPEEADQPTNPMTGQPFPEPPQQSRRPSNAEGFVPSSARENFVGTPFEAAPPDVQHNVMLSAQDVLAQRGLYHGAIDGAFGPDFEFSLRAYQARAHLPVTGRLDLPTLAALELLPHGNRPVFIPRHRLPQPPVRGEWIHER